MLILAPGVLQKCVGLAAETYSDMRFKSIHIQGFRSIQEMSLPFEPNLTTLVGENGLKSHEGLIDEPETLWLGCQTGDHDWKVVYYYDRPLNPGDSKPYIRFGLQKCRFCELEEEHDPYEVSAITMQTGL